VRFRNLYPGQDGPQRRNLSAKYGRVGIWETYEGVAPEPGQHRSRFLVEYLEDEGVLRERIIDEGRRDAYGRIAFLNYETFLRIKAFGVIDDDKFVFPVTQVDLADAMGLTPVHVNRMLKQLRDENLIDIDGKSWTMLHPAGLCKAARYEASYLHLDRAKREPDSEAGKRLKGLI
jgi:hypothetical protein